jgi:glycosyltransferase involved in cell wall biosynthesis
MKIAQISPLAESVPPRLYGGTETHRFYLTEELMRQGHKVTLFASGDSRTAAELYPVVNTALRFAPQVRDAHIFTMLQFEAVRARADGIRRDPLSHRLPAFPVAARAAAAQCRDDPAWPAGSSGYPEMFARHREPAMVSISNDQRRPLPHANWAGTVHHGLPGRYAPISRNGGDDYLAFLGRISPEKRVDRAIEIARRAGMKLGSQPRLTRWTGNTSSRGSSRCSPSRTWSS